MWMDLEQSTASPASFLERGSSGRGTVSPSVGTGKRCQNHKITESQNGLGYKTLLGAQQNRWPCIGFLLQLPFSKANLAPPSCGISWRVNLKWDAKTTCCISIIFILKWEQLH